MLFVASTLLFSSTAFAVGFGVFADFSSGSGEAEWDGGSEWDIDSDMVAGGFVLDTAPSNESTFNYRLNIGLADQTLEDDYGEDLDATGFYVENIFGFALIKKENFRWWLGPLVRIGYYSGEAEIEGLVYEAEIDFDYIEFGVGVVTGLNFKAGQVVISPSIGVRYSAFAGEGEFEETGTYYKYEEDIEAYTVTAFANIALLF